MTLKEKFKQWLGTQPIEQVKDFQLEIIEDEFAIRFAEWVVSTPYDEDLKLTDDILEKFKQKKKEYDTKRKI